MTTQGRKHELAKEQMVLKDYKIWGEQYKIVYVGDW